MTIFGIRVFADVIKMRSYWLRVGSIPMTGVLKRREKCGQRHRENAM